MAKRKRITSKTKIHRSGYEDRVIADLDSRGVGYGYEPFKLPYTIEAAYTPDLELANGVIVECKGYFDYEARRKMLAVKRSHPDLDIRMLFVRDNTIRKGSDYRYSDWCRSNGFAWGVGESVPVEWVDAEPSARHVYTPKRKRRKKREQQG